MIPQVAPSTDLPAYTRQSTASRSGSLRDPVVHTYDLKNGAGRSWLVLNVTSRAPSTVCLPHFYEGEPVKGSVDMMLDKDTQIKSVAVVIHGEIVATHSVSYTFLQVTTELWSLSRNGGRDVLVANGNMDQSRKSKLRGRFSWPFEIRIPSDVELRHERSIRQFHLPPSFYLRGARVTVRYQISVIVTRGRFQPKSELGTQVGYTPIVRPGAPSLARQLAYQENTPLIGPRGDPEGWYQVPTVGIRGRVFSTRRVQARLSLSLAKPLSYPRGSVIPLALEVECDDPQTLDLVASAKACRVRLLRILRMRYDSDLGRAGHTTRQIDLREVDMTSRSGCEDVVDELQGAVWWDVNRGRPVDDRSIRSFQGEIHLLGPLPPSSCLGHFGISYAVALYAPETIGFVVDKNLKGPLRTVPIELATAYPRCARPISYSPPDYESLHSDAADSRIHDALVYG